MNIRISNVWTAVKCLPYLEVLFNWEISIPYIFSLQWLFPRESHYLFVNNEWGINFTWNNDWGSHYFWGVIINCWAGEETCKLVFNATLSWIVKSAKICTNVLPFYISHQQILVLLRKPRDSHKRLHFPGLCHKSFFLFSISQTCLISVHQKLHQMYSPKILQRWLGFKQSNLQTMYPVNLNSWFLNRSYNVRWNQ